MSKALADIQPIIDFCEKYKYVSLSGWLKLPAFSIDIYIRRTKRCIDQQIAETIDLANFEIDPNFRGKGLFTEMLSLVEAYAWENDLTVYIECVHNERLRDFLSRRGYEISSSEERSYYKRKPE